jgi:GT2 family glycosyltransferase
MLDADDLWLPEYLLVMGEALDAEPHAAFAYTDAWLLDDKTKKIRRTSEMFYESPPTTPLPDERTFFLRLLEGNFVHNSVTLRRSVLDEVGGCDESLRVCQDYELWLRIAARGMPAVRPPDLLAIYRSNPASLSGDMRRVIPDFCEIYRRFADDPTADAEVRAVAQRQLAHWTRRLQLLEKPTFASRVRMHAFLAKRRLMSPWLWLRRRPEAVERTLRAVGEIG